MKMHEDEVTIDQNLIRDLVDRANSSYADLELIQLDSVGSDNVVYRLGDSYLVRLPRMESARQNIDKEYRFVPKIAAKLNTPISEPIYKGKPNENYPFDWLIVKWNEGCNPPFEVENEYSDLAVDLATFNNAFRTLNLPGGPSARRGISLETVHTNTQKCLDELDGEFDRDVYLSLWEKLSSEPDWNKPPVWLHGDMLPGNILTVNNRLSAVIDFSETGMGDPACDLIIAWALFNQHSRTIYKKTLSGVDESTWQRGRGWALSIAAIMLPYYKTRSPYMTALARRMLEQVMCDDGNATHE